MQYLSPGDTSQPQLACGYGALLKYTCLLSKCDNSPYSVTLLSVTWVTEEGIFVLFWFVYYLCNFYSRPAKQGFSLHNNPLRLRNRDRRKVSHLMGFIAQQGLNMLISHIQTQFRTVRDHPIFYSMSLKCYIFWPTVGFTRQSRGQVQPSFAFAAPPPTPRTYQVVFCWGPSRFVLSHCCDWQWLLLMVSGEEHSQHLLPENLWGWGSPGLSLDLLPTQWASSLPLS